MSFDDQAEIFFETAQPVSRRLFLKVASALGLLVALKKFGYDWLTDTPSAVLPPPPEGETDPLVLYPAALERRVTGAAFFESDKGHFPFLHELARSDSVKPVVQNVFQVFMNDYLDRGERLGIGSAINIASQQTQTFLRELYPRNPENRNAEEIFHLASIILATIMGKWDSIEQAEELLNYPLRTRFSTLSNVMTNPDSLANQLFPILFGGPDRSMHFMQYLYLTYEYLYLLRHLPQAARFPRFLEQPFLDHLPEENKARVLFSGIGILYEIRSTFYFSDGFNPFSPSYWRREKKRLANEGIADGDVMQDLFANNFGVEMAILIQHWIEQNMPLPEILAQLDKLDNPALQEKDPDIVLYSYTSNHNSPTRQQRRQRCR